MDRGDANHIPALEFEILQVSSQEANILAQQPHQHDFCHFQNGAFHALTYALVAAVLIAPPKLPEKLVPCATWLGDLSYPLYLVQAPVLVMLAANDRRPSCWYFLAFSILGSALVLHFVDYPAQRFFRRQRS